MADWDKINETAEVDDRRDAAGGLMGSIGIITAIVVIAVNLFSSNGNIGQILESVNTISNSIQKPRVDPKEFEGLDTYEKFVSKVMGSNNKMWQDFFEANQKKYQKPRIVLFRNYTSSACGGASSGIGPHYCPNDTTIYLDETFFEELKKLGTKGGDVAEGYVLAHETGHHIQNQLGLLENDDSVKIELMADCFAGIWGKYVSDAAILEPGEISEAMDAASAVGDDNIQKKSGQKINPETFTHGSSEDRIAAFQKGYDSFSPSECMN